MSKSSLGSFQSLSLAVAIATLAQAVAAQPNELETIVVTADRQQSLLRDVPASIFAVGDYALETVRHVHINEILTRVPGAWISRNNGQESLTAIRSPVLSGGGSCGAFQMAQDGIPLRASGFCNVNQIVEANSEQAGAIEVIRGPGSILYGANALHGAINVLSKPVSDDFSADISYELGPHRYNRVRGTVSDTGESHGYRLSVNGNSDGGYKHDSGFDQQKLSFQHQFDENAFSMTNSLHYTNLNQETAGYAQGPEAYKDDDLKRFNPNPESFRDLRSYRFSSRLAWETDANNIVITPYYRKTDMVFLQHYLPGLPLEENGHHSFGLQSMLSNHNDGVLHWQVGVDMETTDGYLRETQSMPTEGSAFLQATIPVGKHYDFTVQSELLSPYAQIKYQVSERNQLTLGLRYENLQYDYDNRMIDGRVKEDGTPCAMGGCRFNRPADRNDEYENASAQLGWIHDFDDDRQVFANLARAFRAPDVSEVYKLQNTQTVADLDSEEVDSFEIGYRASLDRLSYALSAYYMDKSNVIFQDSNRINVSGAETKHRGLEFNTAVALTDELRLTVAASYARHTYEGSVLPQLAGLDMDTAPRTSGSAQLLWQISDQRSLELEWIHLGSYYTDEENTAEYDGHELVNLRYQAEFGDSWYYAARITNLFNTDYAERADFGFGNDRYFVGEPISLYLSVGQRF